MHKLREREGAVMREVALQWRTVRQNSQHDSLQTDYLVIMWNYPTAANHGNRSEPISAALRHQRIRSVLHMDRLL